MLDKNKIKKDKHRSLVKKIVIITLIILVSIIGIELISFMLTEPDTLINLLSIPVIAAISYFIIRLSNILIKSSNSVNQLNK